MGPSLDADGTEGLPPAVAAAASWRPGPGPLGPIRPRRHASDVLRLVLACLLVAATAAIASQPVPTSIQVNAFRLLNELPTFVGSPLLGVMQAGSLPAVAGFAVVALLGRRRRLAPLLSVGGVGAWAVARALQQIVDADPPVLRLSRVVMHGTLAPGFAFPSTHVAVVAAMVAVARGELSRPARRLGWMVVAVVGVARVYLGAQLPVDVLGALGVGWAVGAVVNLGAGVRPGVPDAEELIAVLQRAGIEARTVRLLGSPTEDTARFVIEATDGWRVVKALGRDDPEEDWLRRAWRFLAFRQRPSERAATTASHRVDHEAYVSLLAERAGVRVPPLSATWSAGATELIERPWIPGRPLRPNDAADGALLRDVWNQLVMLERIGIAHRLQPSLHIVVDGVGQPWLVELGAARAGATSEQLHASRAAALADLAEVVGIDAALQSFVDGQGLEPLRSTLPHLNLVEVQSLIGGRRVGAASLDRLRAEAAALCGEVLGATSGPVRVAGRNLLPVVVAGGAVFVLLTHVGQAGAAVAALRHAKPVWVVAAFAGAGCTYLFAGALMVAAARFRLDFWRTVSAQLAAAAANRASPAGLGGLALNLRYMEMSGGTRVEAVSALAVINVTGVLVHVALTIGLVAFVGLRTPFRFSADVDATWPVLATVLVVSTAAGTAVWYWRLHHRFADLVRTAAQGLGSLARSPWRLLLLLASSAGVSVAYALALDASVIAAGGHLSAGRALTVYFAASAIGVLSPAPGGLGTLEAALLAGLSQQGVATGSAIAGVLTYRVITYWLPVVPGLAFLGVLKRRALL